MIDLAVRLEALALKYEHEATFFTGRRRAWRLTRAHELMMLAWQKLGLTP